MTARIIVGDALSQLATLPDESVHCVVTSPPYWGLRAYGGDPCMIGLEDTFDEHVGNLLAVFREVRRVLRKDGTLWLNYGDAYASTPPGNKAKGLEKWKTSGLHGAKISAKYAETLDNSQGQKRDTIKGSGLKPKDLMLMPCRVALALQQDGWWLRSEIVWAKPNPMPESVTDRPSSAHEKLFLFAKSARYFYDAVAVRRPPVSGPSDLKKMEESKDRIGGKHKTLDDPFSKASAATNIGRKRAVGDPSGANLRNVWTIATAPYRGAHFAAFPPALIEPCIKAATSAKGVCPRCGAPWAREAKKSLLPTAKAAKRGVIDERDHGADGNDAGANRQKDGHIPGHRNEFTTVGWKPSCACDPVLAPVPAVVLDPFGGAGTVGLVAARLGRESILIEINPEYAEMARERIADDAPLLSNPELSSVPEAAHG